MHPLIKAFYDESFVDKIETNDFNGSAYTVKKFDAEVFANKILLFCRGIASTHIVSTSPEDFDENLDDETKISETTAVTICGRISSYITDK